MDYINILLCGALLVLLVLEYKRTFTNLKLCREAIKEVKANKTNVEEVKDYMGSVVLFGVMIVIILIVGIYSIFDKQYFTGIMIIGLAFFWVNFIVDSICTKTMLFYDSGFLYCHTQIRYRSVVGFEEKKTFARGYKLKLTTSDEVYVSKNMRTALEQKLKEYKERKKK